MRGRGQRRPVAATAITYIGKEANRLEETTAGLIHDPGEILNTYNDPRLDPWDTLVVPVMRHFTTAEIAANAHSTDEACNAYSAARPAPVGAPKHTHRNRRRTRGRPELTFTGGAPQHARADMRTYSGPVSHPPPAGPKG
jgi:hypothetical protein